MTALNVVVDMGGDEKGNARAALDGGPQSLTGRVVQGLGRLVENEKGRVAEQGAGDAELLNHAGRAAVDPLGDDVIELELLLERAHGRFCLRGGSGPKARVEDEVRVAGQAEVERPFLRERGPYQPASLELPGRVSSDRDRSRRRDQRAGDAPEDGRLPGSIRAAKGDPLARLEPEVERAHDVPVAEATGETVHDEDVAVGRGRTGAHGRIKETVPAGWGFRTELIAYTTNYVRAPIEAGGDVAYDRPAIRPTPMYDVPRRDWYTASECEECTACGEMATVSTDSLCVCLACESIWSIGPSGRLVPMAGPVAAEEWRARLAGVKPDQR